MKQIFVALLVAVIVAVPAGVHAQTVEERDALIAMLLQQIAALTEQLNALVEAEAEKADDDRECKRAEEAHGAARAALAEYENESARLDARLRAEAGSDRLYTRLSVQLQNDREAERDRLEGEEQEASYRVSALCEGA